MTTSTTATGIAVAFIEAFGRGDMAAVAGFLAEDVVFESPRVTLQGAEAVVTAIGQFAQAVDDVRIIAALGDERQALVSYDMVTKPFGTLRTVGHVLVRAGKIISDTVVFDTHAVRMAEGTS